ncbi:MAG: aminotransferase class V-fold PLP-dependent enzyme [Candidatus Eisenbacteria bacterium]|uniref:Aminotransferase class V-fold PLP-dependent enzyme n=1 Tax=Eiseniibacteriota bacterium TaxID=2212470 RepID=A0A538T9D1_UNCEI|nr:MAG: aminotransferase class V-fold PLP-dependent enzyme [Candidatus Eisenbacteria bacterium]
MADHWSLDPDITYLNHGTVGAPPRRVLAAQQAIRDEIEKQPSRFLLRELSAVAVGVPRAAEPRMRAAADRVAAFLGARGNDLVFVDNATTGVNAVLRSFPFGKGDEIVITDHAYGAIANAVAFHANERRALVRTVELPDPSHGPNAFIESMLRAIGSRTRLAIVDHITSESALVLPITEIVARCHNKGVAVLIDGAHAPGMLPLDLPAIGADWYVGNLHKWAYAPRSCAFLWAAPGLQEGLHPTVISWGLGRGFATEFDWVGTRDPSAYLAAPEGIAFMRELGIEAVRSYNHRLAWEGARLLSERLRTSFDPIESMIGSMATVPLPERMGHTKEDAARLRDALLFEDRIEVQLHAWRGRLWVRLSAQIYNEVADVERLATAIATRG